MAHLDLHIDAAASESRKKLLVQKYNTEPSFVDACGDADPTPNGQFTEWMVKTFKDSFSSMNENQFNDLLEDLTEILAEYGRLKNNPQWVRETTQRRGKDAANILTYTFDELKEVLSAATRQNLSKKEQQRELQRKRQKYLDEGALLVGNVNEDLVCYQATHAEAAVLLAEGTHWCVKNESTARHYIQTGTLYFFMREHRPTVFFEPYALCFIPGGEAIGRFEFESPEGHDLYNEYAEGKAWSVDSDAWFLIQYLVQHDTGVADFVKWKWLFEEGTDGPEMFECENCNKAVLVGFEEETYSVVDPETGDDVSICSSECYRDYFATHINKVIEDQLVIDDGEEEEKEALRQLDAIVYGDEGSAEVRAAIRVMREAAESKNVTNQNQDGHGPYEFHADWYVQNADQTLRYLQSGDPRKVQMVQEILPGATVEMMTACSTTLKGLVASTKRIENELKQAFDDVVNQLGFDSPTVANIREALVSEGYRVKDTGMKASLLKKAKAIRIDDRFVNVIMDLIYEIFKNHAYVDADPNSALKDTIKRDTVWEIDKSDWESRGVKFERSGSMPLDGITFVFETDQYKVTTPKQPHPVIYSAGVNEDVPGHPVLVMTLNGNLWVQQALSQLKQYDKNVKLVLKHELAHLYDRQMVEEDGTYTQEDVEDNSKYFNLPHEVRAWINSLLEEFGWFVSEQEGELENELVNTFLKKSRVWKLLSQHLNAQNRRFVLRELSRELEIQKGKRHEQQMATRRGPNGR